jgi:hypothetical protein
MVQLPERSSDLNAAWLRDALGIATPIVALDIQRLGEGVGFQGDVLRVTPQYATPNTDSPQSVIVKLPMEPGDERSFSEMLGVYEREIGFYEELRPEVPLRTPEPLYTAIEPSSAIAPYLSRVVRALPPHLQLRVGPWLAGKGLRRSVLLQEDLAPRTVGDQVAGCSVETAALVLQHLARWHAAFWDSPRLDAFPWLAPLDAAVDVTQTLFERSWPAARDHWSDLMGSTGTGAAEWLHDHGGAVLTHLSSEPRTLLHGDFRLDNLFFGPGPDDLAVIDFQFVQSGRALYDVGYFLSWSLDSVDEVETLLAAYHDALVAAGVSGYSLDDCRRDYQLACLAVVHRGVVILGTIDLTAGRGRELVEIAIRRQNAALDAIDLDALAAAL